ncbi:hypothetical protein Daus18300_003805 [Diaporthe australafricana]|uniref:Letm1 RBD domain-containing protein n=1 Tax=Diaporthe australafricana TaxID=127596 RepID=A0ABR3XD88_9PEZI
MRTTLRVSPSSLLLRPGYCCNFHAPPSSQRAQRRPHQQPQWASRFLSTSPSHRQQTTKTTADLAAEKLDRDTVQPTQTTSPTAANPPATTRPPPLNLPARDPAASTFSHLYATGKAYLTFYKTGFKQIYINSRLVWSLGSASGLPPDTPAAPGQTASPPSLRPAATTRSTEILKRRWRHDIRRLPLFALMFVVCGEFTPLVVLALPGVVPLTCRIPRQIEKLRRAAEARRMASEARLQQSRKEEISGSGSVVGAAAPLSRAEAVAHAARSLGLISPLWDRVPLPDSLVALFASRRVRGHVAFLDQDGHLLSQAGGVPALEDDEVALACEDRGLDVVDRSAAELRESLGRWLALAEPAVDGQPRDGKGKDDLWSPEAVEQREALVMALLAAVQKWPPGRQELANLASEIKL